MIKTLILLHKICEVQFSHELKNILVQVLRLCFKPQQMIEKINYVFCVVPTHGQLPSRSDHSFGFKGFNLLFEP
jgi:hypothetical protein